MKKAYKIISVLTIVLMIACICTNVFAEVTIDGISQAGSTTDAADAAMQKFGGTIIKYITNERRYFYYEINR